jgi:hypothetical protein
VFVLPIAADISSAGKPVYLTNYTRQDGHAGHPKIAALDGGRFVVLWELFEYSTQPANQLNSSPTGYKSTWMTVIDADGKILTPAAQLPQSVRLSMNDVLRYIKANGKVYWAVNVGSNSFVLWALDPGKAFNYKADAALEAKAVPLGADAFSYSVQGQRGGPQSVVITKYKGEAAQIIIPEEINGLPVTAIGNGAFTHSPVTSVVLPKTLTTIQQTSFWYSGIKDLVIPEGVTSIGKQAFSFCGALTSVTIPASMKTIAEFAFMDCANLTTVKIDEDCDMTLGFGAFDKCPSLDAPSKQVISTY